MSARTKARKRALDLLFEADQRGLGIREMLTARMADSGRQTPLPQYSITIAQGVADKLPQIDEVIDTYAQGWAIDRMPAVDRSALRLGIWEILYGDDVDPQVTAAEVTDLVGALSTDESPEFVSGLLSKIIKVRATLI